MNFGDTYNTQRWPPRSYYPEAPPQSYPAYLPPPFPTPTDDLAFVPPPPVAAAAVHYPPAVPVAPDLRPSPVGSPRPALDPASKTWRCTLCGNSVSGTFTAIGEHVLGRGHQTASSSARLWLNEPDTSLLMTLPRPARECGGAARLFEYVCQLGGAVVDVFVCDQHVKSGQSSAASGQQLLVVCADARTVDAVLDNPPFADDLPVRVERLRRDRRTEHLFARRHKRGAGSPPPPPPVRTRDARDDGRAASGREWRGSLSRQLRQLRATSTVEEMRWLRQRLLLTPAESADRMTACRELADYINMCERNVRGNRTFSLQPFGSCVSGLAFHGSDLDIYVDAGDDNAAPADQVFRQRASKMATMLARWLRDAPRSLCSQVFAIPHARVPIVKLVYRPGSFGCDLSFSSTLACHNSLWLFNMLQLDERAELVMVCVRAWAQLWSLSGLADGANKSLSSYCLALLTVAYLQQLSVPVLPSVESVQKLCAPSWVDGCNVACNWNLVGRSANTVSADALLHGFFVFYAQLDLGACVVSPYLGGVEMRAAFDVPSPMCPAALRVNYSLPVQQGQMTPLDTRKPLVIQDPFELNLNVARNCNEKLAARFRHACELAARCTFNELFVERNVQAPVASLIGHPPPAAKKPCLTSVKSKKSAGKNDSGLTRGSNKTAAAAAAVGVVEKASSDKGCRTGPRSSAAATNNSRAKPINKKHTPVTQNKNKENSDDVKPNVSRVCRQADTGDAAASSEKASLVKTDPEHQHQETIEEPASQGKVVSKPINGVSQQQGEAAQSHEPVAVDADKSTENGRKPNVRTVKLSRRIAAKEDHPPLKMPPSAQCVIEPASAADVALLLTNLGNQPAVSFTFPLPAATGEEGGDGGAVKAARSVAELVWRALSEVLLVSCRLVSFADQKTAPSDVLVGIRGTVRRPLWYGRKAVTTSMVKLPQESRLQFERRISEHLVSEGSVAALKGVFEGDVITHFWCYVQLDMDVRVMVNVYRDSQETQPKKKNHGAPFYQFIQGFLKMLVKSTDYVKDFPNALLSK